MKNSARGMQIPRGVFWLASLLFFLSGATGLAYQVIWFKRFGHVWGSSSLAFAAVGGSFLFGLGLGAYLFGRIADRLERPLRWYGYSELIIGCAALVIPLEIQLLINASSGLFAYLPNQPFARYLLQFALTLLVVGPPCVLMGGTLPLLIRTLTAREGALDQATAWLYAINTFGAAAGCYLAGFVLLPNSGLLATNQLAAACNIIIGLIAIKVSRTASVRKPSRADSRAAARTVADRPASGRAARGAAEPASVAMAEARPSALIGLYVAVTFTGLGALILEMTWSRQLALIVGGSTYSYSATLFVVLIGIATGSLLFHVLLRPLALNPWLPIVTVGALAAACLISRTLLPWLCRTAGAWGVARATLTGNAAVCVAAAAIVELVPSLAMGVLFPLFVDLTRATAARVGRAVGDVYAWNTFGSIVGASLTAAVLFPRIGTAGALALAVALYVASLVMVLPFKRGTDVLRAGICAGVGAVLIAGMLIPQDPLLTNHGYYLPDSRSEPEGKEASVIYFVEGASSNVLATHVQPAGYALHVNGKTDASNGIDMAMQLGLAYFPRMIRPDASDVLVIGFGSGTTTGASLLFPDARVTCCELEPAVFGAASCFDSFNHKPQENTSESMARRNAELPSAERKSEEEIARAARLKMAFADGRAYLQQSDRQYDLILSEPSNPWIAGVSNLFTEEFFVTAKQRLRPDGVLAQWIQTYHFSIDDYAMIVRTMQRVFPHSGVLLLSSSDTVLLASDTPLIPDLGQINSFQQFVDRTPVVRNDLQQWFSTTDVKLLVLSRFTVGPTALDTMVNKYSPERVNTDLNMLLEFAAPRDLYQTSSKDAQAALLAMIDTEWMAQLAKAWEVGRESAEFETALGAARTLRLQLADAMRNFRKARALAPGQAAVDQQISTAYRQAMILYAAAAKSDEKIAVLKSWIKDQPDSAEAYLGLANEYWARKDFVNQIAIINQWIKAQPSNPESRLVLCDAYLAQGNKKAAAEALQPLVQIDNRSALQYVATVNRLCMAGEQLAALPLERKALELDPSLAADPRNELWVNDYAWLLATHPDAAMRNGPEAVRLAQQVCSATKDPKWACIDTLAAAYAEIGEFDEALKLVEQLQTRAEQLKTAGKAEEAAVLTAIVDSRLLLYRARSPYREDPQANQSPEK